MQEHIILRITGHFILNFRCLIENNNDDLWSIALQEKLHDTMERERMRQAEQLKAAWSDYLSVSMCELLLWAQLPSHT